MNQAYQTWWRLGQQGLIPWDRVASYLHGAKTCAIFTEDDPELYTELKFLHEVAVERARLSHEIERRVYLDDTAEEFV